MARRLPTAAEVPDRLIAGDARFVRGEVRATTGEFMLVGAVYEIESGVVRFLP